MGIELPTKKKQPASGLPEQETWMVAGAPKIGKTSFCAQWPECLILDLEGGTKYTGGAYVQPILSWEELGSVYSQLRKASSDDELPYETIALDTIDVVNDWAESLACEELGIAQVGEAGYGADWAAARSKVLNILNAFSQLPANLLIVSHSRWAIVDEVKIGHTIDLPGKLARFAMADVDNILFILEDEGERRLVFQPTSGVEAGSRNPTLNDAGSCEFSYEALMNLFEEE